MSADDRVKPQDALRRKPGPDHVMRQAFRRTAVNQHRMPLRRMQQQGVAIADGEDAQAQMRGRGAAERQDRHGKQGAPAREAARRPVSRTARASMTTPAAGPG